MSEDTGTVSLRGLKEFLSMTDGENDALVSYLLLVDPETFLRLLYQLRKIGA